MPEQSQTFARVDLNSVIIMLIDDKPEWLELVKSFLVELGADPAKISCHETAVTGLLRALKYKYSPQPSLVICGYHLYMSGAYNSGLKVLQMLRNHRIGCRFILMATDDLTRKPQVTFLKAYGLAENFLEKPYMRERLPGLLHDCLGLKLKRAAAE